MTPTLRLLADDLTGALDTAAEFAALCGPVPVPLDPDRAAPHGSVALDSGTREMTREQAIARIDALAPAWRGPGIAYKKIDSLLRGHVAAELAACLRAGPWRHCILAPAFPAQRRITRAGRQLAWRDGAWQPAIPQDLGVLLAEAGLAAHRVTPDAPLAEGISLFDAETEDDLARIAALGHAAAGPVLWCGSGGLAGALAGPARVAPETKLALPVLGLFGSDQAVTARQLAACGAAWMRIADAGAHEQVAERLATRGVGLVSLDLPGGTARAAAAARIAEAFAALLARVPRPGALLVAGGETLRAVCRALGARGLLASGLVGPGVPRSVLQGGAWDGLTVISKSGAFGGDALWRDLLRANGLPNGDDA